MHRIDSSTATSDNKFTEGDPTIPIAATTVTADWLNAVQEELIAVISAASLTLSKPDNSQLKTAIQNLITAAQPLLATDQVAGLVKVGSGLSVSESGVLSAKVATAAGAGILRPDGTTCKVEDGVLTVLQSVSEYIEIWRKSWIGVPRWWRSTALPPNHCWANGDFLEFADWPELEELYDAGGFDGMLMTWDADADTQAANLGKWRPDANNPTGLFTPNLSEQFLRAWCTNTSEDAGAWHRDEIRNITGRSSHETDSPTSLPDGAFYKGPIRSDIQAGALTSDTESCFDASRVVPTGPQNVPQHIWQPIILYLGSSA